MPEIDATQDDAASTSSQKGKKKKLFRFQAKAIGLTYACPTSEDVNPLDATWDAKEIIDRLRQFGTIEKYILCREKHESGKHHYHAYIKFAEKLETENVKFFDINGVHPNIIRKPGTGWITYCAKDDDYITNFYEPCPWVQARDAATAAEGVAILWNKRPREMALHAKNIIENLSASKRQKLSATIYNGPWLDICWKHQHMTLILRGLPGVGKTQWARWWGASHGGYFYCKGSLECLRHYNNEAVIIYDDIKVDNYAKLEWDDVFDVENGGNISSRYKDISIPPGPKIWLQNHGISVPDPYHRIYGRRAYTLDWDIVSTECYRYFCENERSTNN